MAQWGKNPPAMQRAEFDPGLERSLEEGMEANHSNTCLRIHMEEEHGGVRQVHRVEKSQDMQLLSTHTYYIPSTILSA